MDGLEVLEDVLVRWVGVAIDLVWAIDIRRVR